MRHRRTVQPRQINEDDIPFLKRKKATKKEKQDTKSSLFKSKITQSTSSTISKSARKRQNKKQRNNLHGGGLSDLLSTLPEIQEALADKPFVEVPRKPLDPRKSRKNNDKVTSREIARFDRVVNDKQFKKDPFALMKQKLEATISVRDEFHKLDDKKNNRMQT